MKDIDEEDDDPLDDLWHITIYFRGSAKSLHRETNEIEKVNDILNTLFDDLIGPRAFFSFTDLDGEEVIFNAAHVVLFILSKDPVMEEADTF